MILIIRECVTSYTVCSLIPDEQKVTLGDVDPAVRGAYTT